MGSKLAGLVLCLAVGPGCGSREELLFPKQAGVRLLHKPGSKLTRAMLACVLEKVQ